RAEKCIREPHAGSRVGFRLAAIDTRSGEAERAEQHRRQQREQHERDGQLDQREATGAVHGGFLCASFNVASETVRSPPLSLGKCTSTVTRLSRVGIVSDARAMSSGVFGGS